MTFTFYNSLLCPRCARTRKHLRDLLGSDLDNCMQEIDAGIHPVIAWKAGIRMIPALKCGQDIESGIILDPEKIRLFLIRNGLLDTGSNR